jgi:endonuclease YncB( thermonuclease family)
MAGGQAVSSNRAILSTPEEDAETFGTFDQNEPAANQGELKAGAGMGPLAQIRSTPSDGVASAPSDAAEPAPPVMPQQQAQSAGPAVRAPKAERNQDKVLYRPVATDAGTIDAMGYKVLLVGVDTLGPDEKCSFDGRSWPCGARARTEFRAWLRDRAVTCEVPAKPGGRAVLTRCRIGNSDAGAWLVQNGWARAEGAGPYVKAGEKARAEKRGIYGRPPWQAPGRVLRPQEANLPKPLP